jgi:hypothetical protein
MRWFGESWKGEVCSAFLQVPNPGGSCSFCRETIAPDDRGFVFDGGAACHKKCLSRAIKGKTWVDHIWTSRMHSLWNRGWTCSRCGVVVFADPDTEEGRKKNEYDRKVTEDCTASLVDAVSKS